MFNLIDTQTGDKVDFWVLTDSPFDRSRFARRRRVDVFGSTVSVSPPEDIILAKMSPPARPGLEAGHVARCRLLCGAPPQGTGPRHRIETPAFMNSCVTLMLRSLFR
jgi:hypothetical protein